MSNSMGAVNVDQFIVGFCGKIYPVLRLSKFSVGSNPKTAFCFNLVDVDTFIESNFKDEQVKAYKSKKKGCDRSAKWDTYYQTQDKFAAFFTKCKQQENKFEKFFFDNKTPVFVAKYKHGGIYRADSTNSTITYNSSLREVEFYRLFNTQTTYQEIFMYVAGVLGQPTKPIPVPSDEIMRDIKGFDKWSFKKEPSSTKRRPAKK